MGGDAYVALNINQGDFDRILPTGHAQEDAATWVWGVLTTWVGGPTGISHPAYGSPKLSSLPFHLPLKPGMQYDQT